MSVILDLKSLNHVINLLPGNGEEWRKFAFEMHQSEIPSVVRAEAEIARARDDSSGGFHDIVGELLKGFACFSDPVLLERRTNKTPSDIRVQTQSAF